MISHMKPPSNIHHYLISPMLRILPRGTLVLPLWDVVRQQAITLSGSKLVLFLMSFLALRLLRSSTISGWEATNTHQYTQRWSCEVMFSVSTGSTLPHLIRRSLHVAVAWSRPSFIFKGVSYYRYKVIGKYGLGRLYRYTTCLFNQSLQTMRPIRSFSRPQRDFELSFPTCKGRH